MSESHKPVPLLVIDDDAATLRLVQDALSDDGLEVHTASDPQAGLEAFKSIRPRIVLVDLMMPAMTGMDVLEQILSKDPGVEVILMTGHYSTDSAVEAIQKGARDYLDKPLNLQKLRARISGLLAELKEKEAAFRLERQLIEVFQFEGMIGRSPLMLDVFAKIRRVAPHFQTVLITGPTGTGKELVARALHNLRNAGSGPFAVCNCAAVVDTLFESELFGYAKGAFTGATEDKTGLFEYANRGTVFLDEIGEMPLPAQAKLLRVLQEKEVQRVGSPVPRKVDVVRVVAATNRDLSTLIKEGKFREDLFYRLGMIEISLPRLADRREDLQILERFMVEKYAKQYGKKINGITRRAQNALSAYSWPGNVRELENVMQRAVTLARRETLDVDDIHLDRPHASNSAAPVLPPGMTLEQWEQEIIREALRQANGNKSQAARALGLSRNALRYRLSQMGVPDPDTKESND
jgi:DNA-binding NtrC family response regulator